MAFLQYPSLGSDSCYYLNPRQNSQSQTNCRFHGLIANLFQVFSLHSTIRTLGTGYIRSSNEYSTVYPWLEFYTRSNYSGNFPSTSVFLRVWHSANHRDVTPKNGVGSLLSLQLFLLIFPALLLRATLHYLKPGTGYLIVDLRTLTVFIRLSA